MPNDRSDVIDHRPDHTLDLLCGALSQSPSNTDALDNLEQHAELHNNWQHVCTKSLQALSCNEDTTIITPALIRICGWYTEYLRRPDIAMQGYKLVLYIDQSNVQAYSHLCDIYRANNEWNSLAKLLELAASLVLNPEDKLRFYMERGSILHEQLDDIPAAIETYNFALDVDNLHVPALKELEKIHLRNGSFSQCVSILRRRIRVEKDREILVVIYMRLGYLLDFTLGDTEKAISVYENAAIVAPNFLSAYRCLENCYLKLERFQDAIGALYNQLRLTQDGKEKSALLSRISSLREKSSEEFPITPRREEEFPNNAQIQRVELEGLCRYYERTNSFTSLARTLERLLHLYSENEKRFNLLLQLGELNLSKLNDAEKSIQFFKQALQSNPTCIRAIKGLCESLERLERWEESIETLEAFVTRTEDRQQKTTSLYHIANVEHSILSQSQKAIETLHRVLVISPLHPPTHIALRHLLVKTGQPEVANDVADTLIAQASYASTRASICHEMGSVFLNAKMLDGAVEWFERAMFEDPSNFKSAKPLADYYFEQQNYAEAEPLIDQVLQYEQSADCPMQASLNYRMALIKHGKGDSVRALSYARASYQISPTQIAYLRLYAELLFDCGFYRESFKLHCRSFSKLSRVLSKKATVEIIYRIAVAGSHVATRQQAISWLKQALSINPKHEPSLLFMKQLS